MRPGLWCAHDEAQAAPSIRTFREIREEGCYYVDKAASHHPVDMHMKGPRFGSRDRQESTVGGRIGYELFLITGLRYPDAMKMTTVDGFRTFD